MQNNLGATTLLPSRVAASADTKWGWHSPGKPAGRTLGTRCRLWAEELCPGCRSERGGGGTRAGSLLSHCGCGALEPQRGGKRRHPLGQGSLRLSKQPVRISAGASGRYTLTALSLFVSLTSAPLRFALDQRLLSHPRMDSGALALGEVPRASSELGRQ